MKIRHRESFNFIADKTSGSYSTGIILGTGLGGLVKYIDDPVAIDYRDIPHFPVSTVEFHSGKLIFGRLSGKKIVAMQGRFHFYEGYDHKMVTYPVHIMKMAGVRNLIVSNACGAINPKLRRSDLMIMTSHINLHFSTPLFGNKRINGNSNGNFYDRKLISLAEKIAVENGIDIRKGIYASVQGPNLETKSEYRMMKVTGADVVGMSTIPEVLVAKELGIKILGLSIVTDEGFPDVLKTALLEHIIEAASIAEPKLVLLIQKLVENLNSKH